MFILRFLRFANPITHRADVYVFVHMSSLLFSEAERMLLPSEVEVTVRVVTGNRVVASSNFTLTALVASVATHLVTVMIIAHYFSPPCVSVSFISIH